MSSQCADVSTAGWEECGGGGQCEVQSHLQFPLLPVGNHTAVESLLHMRLQMRRALVKPAPLLVLYAVKWHYSADGACKQVAWDITLLGTWCRRSFENTVCRWKYIFGVSLALSLNCLTIKRIYIFKKVTTERKLGYLFTWFSLKEWPHPQTFWILKECKCHFSNEFN